MCRCVGLPLQERPMTLPSPKVCRRIRRLHAMTRSPNANEAANAQSKLDELLFEWSLTEDDLSKILGDTNDEGEENTRPSTNGQASNVPNVLAVLLRLLEEHIAVTADERIAIALWLLHTWIFDRFQITPRLALMSPVRGCGKTTLLSLIELLIYEGERIDSVSAAAIYHQLDRRPRTVWLVDEADNLDLFHNNVLRSVFNSGHRRGGGVSRFVAGWPRRYPTFAPMAVAAIGMLPLPLMHRSIVINMHRSSAELKRLDQTDRAFAWTREAIRDWVETAQLAPDPKMPPELRNRAADNWRPLLSIADAFEFGETARLAAVALSAERPDEDPGVTLLMDIRDIFQALGIDRIPSSVLVDALTTVDHGIWHEWRGLRDDRQPRKLTQSELSRLLRPFRIGPKTIWKPHRRPGDKSSRGYMRSQFEAAWAAYCPASDTPTQASKITRLLWR
jgi:hypothetical protein